MSEENSSKSIPAMYKGSPQMGEVQILKKDIPKNCKFYFQLNQTLGPFVETDYYTLDEKKRSIPIDKTIAVIPCYNVEAYCKNVVEKSLPHVKKLILIDDGSTDNTKNIIKELAEANTKQIVFLNMEKNRGKGFCLLDAFRYALKNEDFEALITLDSDSQHKPEDIPRFTEAILSGEEFVMGTRTFKEMPFRSRIANTLIAILLKFVFPHAPKETQSGYRAFNKPLVKEFIENIDGGLYEMEFDCLLYSLLKRKRIRAIPISTIYINDNASSKFSVVRDSIKILKVLFHYGTRKNKQA